MTQLLTLYFRLIPSPRSLLAKVPHLLLQDNTRLANIFIRSRDVSWHDVCIISLTFIFVIIKPFYLGILSPFAPRMYRIFVEQGSHAYYSLLQDINEKPNTTACMDHFFHHCVKTRNAFEPPVYERERAECLPENDSPGTPCVKHD